MIPSTLLLLATCGLASSFSVSTHRAKGAGRAAVLGADINSGLYWYGHFTVGDKELALLIDTGSADLIVNPGEYKPSKNQVPYPGNPTFIIQYEGINRAGFGFEQFNGTLHRDAVSAGGLCAHNQTFGEVKTFKYIDTKPQKYAYRNNGIIGFEPSYVSAFKPQALPWVYNLCHEKVITDCRFALAFGTSGKGQLVVGEIDKSLIDGDLTYTPTVPFGWTVQGDVLLNGKIIHENQTIVMDVGTDNIQGPLEQANAIFKQLGYPYTEQKGTSNIDGGPPYITNSQATFHCDSPPELAFGFPPQSSLKAGQKSKIITVSKDVWNVYDNGHNNCTSILAGTNFLTKTINQSEWLVGQPLFAGHYIDFDMTNPRMGFGDLVDPTGGS